MPATPSSSSTPAATLDWRLLGAGGVAIAAGLWLHSQPARNEALFHLVNGLGPAAPATWSALSVAGLALAAWIYLTAFAQAAPERVAQLLWGVIVGGLVASWVKHHLPSPRPFLALGAEHLVVIGTPLSNGSMPSGHSAMAFAMLAVLCNEKRRLAGRGAGPLATPWALWLVGLLALAIALSRMAVGAHWPADTLVGGGLGLVFGALAPHAWPVGTLTRWLGQRGGRVAMALGLFVCALCVAATPGLLQATGLDAYPWARRLEPGYPLAAPLQLVLALVALAGAWRWARASLRPAAH